MAQQMEFSIDISGSGILADIKAALLQIVQNIDHYEKTNNLNEAVWEDHTLCTTVSLEDTRD